VRLDGARALVTGAGRGIGRAICEAFVAEGARVVAVARSQNELAELEEAHTGRVVAAPADLLVRSEIATLASRIERMLGGLDVLVNNAGIWFEKPFLEISREDWDRTLRTNLTAVFDVTQLLLPLLLRSPSARVINIAAIDGEKGFPRLVAQCASKAGLLGLTRALARELWDRPITVNAIAPAEVDKSVPYAATPRRVPAPERALPWDVARAAVYLASDEGVRVNGACLDVHGVGFLAS
jgi:NAD(P)-dependent dehydrogenase (short-subunit alcohol dehydrogenase family)